MLKGCLSCGNEFDAPIREVNRGNGKYCSKHCFTESRRGLKIVEHKPNVICAMCGTAFYKSLDRQENSKSGLFFCAKICKDNAQRLGGIKDIQPGHYGTGISTYRQNALRLLLNECNICGYNSYTKVLEIHHKDGDRTNNEVDNLEVLCPTHHKEKDYTRRGIIWA